MKRLSLVVATISAVCLTFQSAQASLLFSEGFDYTSGSDLGGNVNPGNSTAWTGSSAMTIGSDNLTYQGLQDLGGNDLSVAWGATAGGGMNTFANVTSGQVYYSFLLNMTTGSSGNAYLTAMNPGTTTPGGSSDAVDIYIDGSHSQALRLRTAGESEFSSGSSPTLSLNTTYLIVLGYDFGSSTASLWLNPTPGTAQPTATESIVGGGAVTAIDNVGFKSQSSYTGDFLVDNIRVGTTWADVVTAVPEPSMFAFAGLSLAGLLLRFRRR